MQVDVQFIDLLDRDEPSVRSRTLLEADRVLRDFHWKPQRGGTELPERIHERLETLWREFHSNGHYYHPLVIDGRSIEGQEVVSFRRHRRRERQLRAKKIAFSVHQNEGQVICEVCRLNLTATFGLAVGFVTEVHHLIPFAELEGLRETSIDDLAVVCPTCHRFLHSRTPVYTIADARSKLSERWSWQT